MALAREASRMDDRWISRRGSTRPARHAPTASAARALAVGGYGDLVCQTCHRMDAACASRCAQLSASAALPLIQCGLALAFGPRPALRAQGVRRPERVVTIQGGDPATTGLRQPTGGHVPDPCSMDGRAGPAPAGQKYAPPAPAGRLAP